MIPYKVQISNNKLHMEYFGDFFIKNSQKVIVFLGYTNEWNNVKMIPMNKTENGFVMDCLLEDDGIINFCFTNEDDAWDYNEGAYYSIYVVLQEKSEIESNNKVLDNGLLLISEVQNKVFLPYTKEEIENILQNEDNKYQTPQEVIDNVYIKSFEYYRNQYTARWKEAIELITKREKMSYIDGIKLAMELFAKRFLHPAIISSCKNLDELNVYLDCLEKNELDDFKIFRIEYEINPLIIRDKTDMSSDLSLFNKIITFFKNISSFNRVND